MKTTEEKENGHWKKPSWQTVSIFRLELSHIRKLVRYNRLGKINTVSEGESIQNHAQGSKQWSRGVR
jgi:hypothetical protein